MFRRFAAALLAVSMLHLSFLGADLACSKHGDESAHSAAALAEGDTSDGELSHGDMSHDAQAGTNTASHFSSHHTSHASHAPSAGTGFVNASNDPPCEIPAQSNCCQAFMGCSIVFSANADVTIASSVAPRIQNVGHAQRAPLSDVPPPEPPPPRA